MFATYGMILFSSIWLSMGVVLAYVDPIDAAARGERLTIVGILIVGIILLGGGIIVLYRQQVKALEAAKAEAALWREHHDTAVGKMTEERQQRHDGMLQIMTNSAVALNNSATAVRAVEAAISSLEHTIRAGNAARREDREEREHYRKEHG